MTTISRNVCLTVPMKDMLTILDFENKNWNDEALSTILDKIPGVERTDYSGHFGSHVFFTLNKEFDTKSTRTKIDRTIVKFVAKALKDKA